MMHSRNHYSAMASKRDYQKLEQAFKEEEMRREGKNKPGGTGFKMSDEKKKKARLKRKR